MSRAVMQVPEQEAISAVAGFRAYARFVSVDPLTNRYRFSSLTWQPMLFGDGCLVRSWGRIGTKGRSVENVFPDRASAQELVDQSVKRRLRRGYQVMDVH
jgi:predicted DNA-binding WGR domain protein